MTLCCIVYHNSFIYYADYDYKLYIIPSLFTTVSLPIMLIVIINLYFNISDVRDVAHAHILAMELAHIKGRYCFTAAKAIHLSEVLQMVHENWPGRLPLPRTRLRDMAIRIATMRDTTFRREMVLYQLSRSPLISNSRALDVGMVLRPPVQTIIDTVRFFIDHDLLDGSGVDRGSSGSRSSIGMNDRDYSVSQCNLS